MSSFVRLALIGMFGLAGVGLAICLAMSSTLIPVAAASAKPRPRPLARVETSEQRPLHQPTTKTPVHVPAHPPAYEPAPPPQPGPWVVAPYPAFAQQPVTQGIDSDMLKRLVQLGEQLTQPPARPAPSEVQPPKPSDTVVASDEPELSSASPAPARPAKRQITKGVGEGDNNLTIHIQDTDIREVLDMLSEQGGLNILASNSVQGKVSAALNNVDIDTALAAILKSTGFVARHEGKFIFVASPQDITAMEQSVDKVGTRVYRPNYVRAIDLQALVTPLLTQGIGTVSVTGPAQVGIAPDTANTGGNGFAGSEAVLVRDYEAVLCQVDQVFQEIDKRPLQVAIEAMILSVKLDDKNSRGVDFQLLRDKNNVRLGTGAPLSDLGEVSFSDGGLKFGFLDSSLGAFLGALETIGDTNVIATPRLMCVNKHKAEILIGEKLGYLSTTQTETSTTQTVEFLEVGTQLRLRPFISEDGLIRMEVHPELSTGSVDVEGAFTLPNKVVTEVTTNIMVRDGCTVIIGGLMRENLDKTSTQIPFLGSAPGIGFLFRSKTETTQRNELIVLITPHIVYEPEACAEGHKGACEFHRRQAVYADRMSPIGTRFLGRKYFRLAQDAWAAGDKPGALRLVNAAIQFDPVNRAAIELRSDIMANNHFGNYSGGPVPGVGPNGEPLGPEHPGDADPEVQPPGGVPLHPWDPGQAGRIRNIEKPGSLR